MNYKEISIVVGNDSPEVAEASTSNDSTNCFSADQHRRCLEESGMGPDMARYVAETLFLETLRRDTGNN